MHTHIGKYEVHKLLGKGATGSVYLATDPFQQRQIAIKVLDAMPSDPEDARRALKFFQNEASLAGKLRHPHIVSIFDAGIDKKDGKNLLYLVMELVEGTSLQPHRSAADVAQLADRLQVLQGARIREHGGRRAPRHQAREHHAAAGLRH